MMNRAAGRMLYNRSVAAMLLVVGLLLAACAPGDDPDTGAEPEAPETSAEGEEEATDEPPDADPADSDETEPAEDAEPAEDLEEVTLRIGFVPFSAFGAVVSLYMRDNGLLEEHGSQLGLDIQAEWADFPGCPPQIQAMIAADLDLSGCGFIPASRAIMEGQDIRIFSIYEGALDVWLAVRPDSGIESVEDLQGKTIGTFVGGDIEFFLTQLLDAHLGSPNPADHNISVVNVPSPAAMADMPGGVDAVTIFGPHFLRGQEQGTLEGLVSNQGRTGTAWAEGEDAGPPDEMANSPAYPEAYMLHRAVWLARGGIADEHPEAIEAFYLAMQQALDELLAMDPAEVAGIAAESWEIDGELGAQIVESDLLWMRGWAWWTAGDIEGLVRNGELGVEAGVFEEAITMEQVEEQMSAAAEMAERAYAQLGVPEPDEFLDESSDIRGDPFWDYLGE